MWLMKFFLLQVLSGLLPSVSAHFRLNYPEAREFDEDELAVFPCGGQDNPSNSRTPWPLSGGPIQLNMQHDRVAVQVLLGLGDNVGANFNITLVPTFEEEGLGDFCMESVVCLTNITVFILQAGCSLGYGRLSLQALGLKMDKMLQYRLSPAVILMADCTMYELFPCIV